MFILDHIGLVVANFRAVVCSTAITRQWPGNDAEQGFFQTVVFLREFLGELAGG